MGWAAEGACEPRPLDGGPGRTPPGSPPPTPLPPDWGLLLAPSALLAPARGPAEELAAPLLAPPAGELAPLLTTLGADGELDSEEDSLRHSQTIDSLAPAELPLGAGVEVELVPTLALPVAPSLANKQRPDEGSSPAGGELFFVSLEMFVFQGGAWDCWCDGKVAGFRTPIGCARARTRRVGRGGEGKGLRKLRVFEGSGLGWQR